MFSLQNSTNGTADQFLGLLVTFVKPFDISLYNNQIRLPRTLEVCTSLKLYIDEKQNRGANVTENLTSRVNCIILPSCLLGRDGRISMYKTRSCGLLDASLDAVLYNYARSLGPDGDTYHNNPNTLVQLWTVELVDMLISGSKSELPGIL